MAGSLVSLEQVLAQLLVPDNDTIMLATKEFNERARQPGAYGCIPELVQIMQLNPHPEVGMKE